MEKKSKIITVETSLKAPIDHVWECWTSPVHIVNWNFASGDWHCPYAENEAKSGGKFNWRMEAKDGSMGFDFNGTYDEVKEKELISYKMSDGRAVNINFSVLGDEIKLSESFETEETNSDEMQRTGWQAILNNFRKYVEAIK